MEHPARFEHDRIVVSVPVYNERDHIEATLQSVKAQTWDDFLAVVSDNGSTDGTTEICRDLIAGDPRFHFVRHEANRGSAFNFNFVRDVSDSPYFMWFGGHDLIAPDFLETHLAALDLRPGHSLSYALTQWIDRTGRPLRVSNPSRLNHLRGGGLARYLLSAATLGKCEAINNVIRRSAFGPTRLSGVPGCDNVILSELLFSGPAHLVNRPLYFRRDLEAEADRAVRLAGPAVPKDGAATVDLYLESFDRLPAPALAKAPLRVALPLLLRLRFDEGFGPRRLIRKLLGR